MELTKLADIIQGNIPTRIEVSSGQSIETITMQELNYIANVSDDLPIEKYLDPYYLCWYINNNKAALKELNKLKQATAAVSVIPLSMLKGFDIVLLPIEKQRIIGKINELKRKRDRLTRIIETKKSDILTQQLVKMFEKESKNGNKRV